MISVTVNPHLLKWARERAGLTREDLTGKFKKLNKWETGEAEPTLRQIEAFADAVHVPVGYLFLSEPPKESLPIPDFRTMHGQTVSRPSPDLIDTIHTCQERQSWYREFARVSQHSKHEFVGSATYDMSPSNVAARMSNTLDFDTTDRNECSSWTDALRLFIQKADRAGVLVMVGGVVMGNNHRSLDVSEFRGFALSDPFAPLVFINGSDTKAAQIFTLAHELAHIWLGSSALSNMGVKPTQSLLLKEEWCNKVAAEFLVPLDILGTELNNKESLPDTISRLARTFKVSTLVILRRLLDTEWIDRADFESYWDREIAQFQTSNQSSSGGDFYRLTISRVGHRFVSALVVSTLEGQTLYRDAFRMLGIKKVKTLKELGRKAGVAV